MSMNELIGTPRLPEPEQDEPWVKELAGGGYEYRCHICKSWHDWDGSFVTVRKIGSKRRIICGECRGYFGLHTTKGPDFPHPWDNRPDLTTDAIDSMEPLAMGTGWMRPMNQENKGGHNGTFTKS